MSWLVEGTAMKSRMHLLATGGADRRARRGGTKKPEEKIVMNLQQLYLYAPEQTHGNRQRTVVSRVPNPIAIPDAARSTSSEPTTMTTSHRQCTPTRDMTAGAARPVHGDL